MMDIIKLGNQSFNTILAVSDKDQENGLMHKAWPPPIMTFVYTKPQLNYFWMKNTPSPLDIVFCNNEEILFIVKGESLSEKLIGLPIPTDMIVELPYGTCKKYNICTGQQSKLIYSIRGFADIIQHKYGHVLNENDNCRF